MIDPPLAGAWNMAVDEALLESAAGGTTTLRFYQWSEPTLSLGYFQPLAARQQHAASQDSPLVRRASGGGAILHDQELTYSFAAPIRERFAQTVERLYYAFHESLLETLAELGVTAELCLPERSQQAPSREPFLCFQRRTKGDVLCAGQKICGSAQRRQRGAVLQHGSVLLRQSAAAPELAGVLQLSGVEIAASTLASLWTLRLTQQLGISLAPASLLPEEQTRVANYHEARFAASDWTQRR